MHTDLTDIRRAEHSFAETRGNCLFLSFSFFLSLSVAFKWDVCVCVCVCTFGARLLHPGLEKATVSLFRPRRMERSSSRIAAYDSFNRERPIDQLRSLVAFGRRTWTFTDFRHRFDCSSDGIEIVHAPPLPFLSFFFLASQSRLRRGRSTSPAL